MADKVCRFKMTRTPGAAEKICDAIHQVVISGLPSMAVILMGMGGWPGVYPVSSQVLSALALTALRHPIKGIDVLYVTAFYTTKHMPNFIFVKVHTINGEATVRLAFCYTTITVHLCKDIDVETGLFSEHECGTVENVLHASIHLLLKNLERYVGEDERNRVKALVEQRRLAWAMVSHRRLGRDLPIWLVKNVGVLISHDELLGELKSVTMGVGAKWAEWV